MVALQLAPADFAALQTQGLAIALVGSKRAGASSVRVEDKAGGRAAARHLLNLGHERIGFVGIRQDEGSPLGGVPPAERLVGYQEALAEAGMPADSAVVFAVENTVDAGAAAMAELLVGAEPQTALVAASDELAFGALATLRRAGMDVPGEYSVVGYDNHELAGAIGLTTMDHGVSEQGRLAAEAVVAALSGAPATAGTLEPRLVVRHTTAPPRRLRRPAFPAGTDPFRRRTME